MAKIKVDAINETVELIDENTPEVNLKLTEAERDFIATRDHTYYDIKTKTFKPRK